MMGWKSNMQNLYFFRHGETNLNKEGRFQGQSNNPPLNKKGVAQAVDLSHEFSQIPLEIIYTSPLKRAMQTANIVAENTKVEVKTEQRLIEGNFGIAEGLIKNELEKNMPNEYAKWRDFKNMNFAFSKGESKAEILSRLQNFLEDLKSVPYHHIGISTHSAVIRCFMIYLGIYMDKIPNAQILHIIFKDGKFLYIKTD